MIQQTLVLIKPDAMVKCLAGHIITDFYNLDIKMAGLKLVNVQKELAEQHYENKKDHPAFNEIIQHLTGELHNQENVIAIVYQGEDAINKVRKLVGETHPDNSGVKTIRGKYGKIHTKTGCFESVVHASDSSESAEKEIALWFSKEELISTN
jgi:nucleoside-diphosphate kinase